MTTGEKALALHKEWNGKLETISKSPVKSREDLSLAYTPGVAEPCKVIAENKEAAWTFLKWWTSAETQTEYGYAVEGYFGSKTRWSSANVDAFMSLPWTAEEKAVLQTVLDWLVQVPVVLGDYQTTRFVTFAFNQVVVQGLNTRDALEDAVESINKELKRKQKEYNITPADEEDLLNPEFDIRPSDYLPKYKDIINQNKNAQGGKS